MLTPLLEGHVSIPVDSKGEGMTLRIVLLNEIEVIGKVLKHLDEMVSICSLDGVSLHEIDELSLVELTVMDISRERRSDCEHRKNYMNMIHMIKDEKSQRVSYSFWTSKKKYYKIIFNIFFDIFAKKSNLPAARAATESNLNIVLGY